MIALNELLSNVDYFKEKYALMGLNFDIDEIVFLANERKNLQQATENLRATCNKMCSEIASKKNNGENLLKETKKINEIDALISKNSKIIEILSKKINKKLSKLHALAENDNIRHLQISKFHNKSTLEDVEHFLSGITQIDYKNQSIPKYLKSLKNVVFDENDMPQIVKCKKSYVLLTTKNDFDDLRQSIMQYFEQNSEHIIVVSCKKLVKTQTASYLIHLNKSESVYFEIIKDFEARDCNIKYHNKNSDMTKFVHQMNIYLKFYQK